MVSFVEQFADNMKVDQKDILVSSTQLTDGIIVKVKDDFYTVNLNADQQSYTVTETHLINNKINIISK
ncbi:hypothetical protein RU85_GL001804 [Lactococcus garvieae]|jgi:hypothetical protein|nr:hypothetical protein RU85_GL001804 [Lactococcus garvieae]